MAAVARVIGAVAGTVAAVASVIPGGQVVAAIAGAVSLVAGIGAQILAKPPAAEGQVNERVIGANHPLPYLMGRSYTGGIQIHDVGYGGKKDGVENPYRWIVSVLSVCGPIKSVGPTLANFAPVGFSNGEATGYYNEYWWRDTQLGARPELSALAPHFSNPPNWSSSHKTSGFAAVGHNLKWSKKGKRFAGGQLPVIAQVSEGISVYDPRLDSTYPGGSGPQRINDEDTWTYSRNPALHALAYAYGRHMNGKKIFGVDLGGASIDISDVVAWANVCDANSWFVDGTIYEPGDKWANLKRICQAGGAKPLRLGGILHFSFTAPRTSLYTITRDDLVKGPVRDQSGKRWKQRRNTIVPRYRSEAHQWEYVQSDPVSIAAAVARDGEEKLGEIQYDLVTGKDQAAQLTLLHLHELRERGPYSRVLKPHMRAFRPGDCLTLGADHSPTGSDFKVKMTDRTIDPLTGYITAAFVEENDAKHGEGLSATGTAPAVPPTLSPEEIDNLISLNQEPPGFGSVAISGSYTTGLAGQITQSANGDGTVDVVIPAHTRVYSNGTSVAVNGAALTLGEQQNFLIFYDDGGRTGGAVPYQFVNVSTGGAASDAYFSETNPDRHFVASVTTVDGAGVGGSTGGSSTPGGGGWKITPEFDIP